MNGKPVDELGRCLREGALADSPAFSAELHAHVMEKLRAEGLELLEGEQRTSRWRWFVRRAVPLALAAGLGVVAWITLRPQQPLAPDTHPPVVYHQILPDDLVAPLQENVAPATEAWDRGKYGYLDQDARRLMVFVASQLPGVPVTDGGNGN